MIFEQNKLYKHEHGRDAAIYVLEQVAVEDGVELDVLWYNVYYNEIGACPPFQAVEAKDRIFIHKNKFKQWRKYIPEEHYDKLKG